MARKPRLNFDIMAHDKTGQAFSELQEKVRRTEQRLASAQKQFMAAAAAATLLGGGLAAIARQGASQIDEAAKAARRLGASVGGFRALQLAASEAGVPISALPNEIQNINRELANIGISGNADRALDRLGMSASDLVGLEADEKVALIADAVNELGLSSGEATAILRDLGVRNREMVLLLGQGGDAIREAKRDIDAYGLALSDVDAGRIEAANDAIGRLGLIGQYASQRIALELVPAMGRFADAMTDSLREGGLLRDMIDGLVDNLGRLATYVGTAVSFLGVRYVGALVAAKLATFGLSGALVSLQAAMSRFLPVALAIGVGELVHRFREARSAATELNKALEAGASAREELNRQMGIYVNTHSEAARQAAIGEAEAVLAAAEANLQLAESRLEAEQARQRVLAGPNAAASTVTEIEAMFRSDMAAARAEIEETLTDIDALKRGFQGPPVAPDFGSGGSTDDLANAIGRASARAYEAIPAMSELRAQYGGLAGVVRDTLVAQNELAASDMQSQIAGLVGQVAALGDELDLGADKMAFLVGDFERMAASGSLQQQAEAMAGLAAYIAEASGGLDQMAPAVRAVYDEIIATALGAAEVANQMNVARGQAIGLTGAAAQIAGAIMPAVGAAIQLGNALGGAMARLGGLVSGMTRLNGIAGAVSGALGSLGGALGSWGRDAIGAASGAFSEAIGNLQGLWQTAQSGSASVADLRTQLDGLFAGSGGGTDGGGAGGSAVEGLSEVEEAAAAAAERVQSVGSTLAGIFSEATKSAKTLTEWIGRVVSRLSDMLIDKGFQMLFAAIGGTTAGSNILGTVADFLIPNANANGNAFSAGRVVPFATGGVVSSPTFFPMTGDQTGLMGEAGPEAIMPLKRGPGGLGVVAHGADGETILPLTRGSDGKLGVSALANRIGNAFSAGKVVPFASGGVFGASGMSANIGAVNAIGAAPSPVMRSGGGTGSASGGAGRTVNLSMTVDARGADQSIVPRIEQMGRQVLSQVRPMIDEALRYPDIRQEV